MSPLVSSTVVTIILIFVQFASAKKELDQTSIQELKDEIYARVITPKDDLMRLDIKYQMVDYLVETTISDYLDNLPVGRQDEDGDGDAADGAGDNTQVLNGVRRILQNVFAGNLIGVIQESVSVNNNGPVQVFFADVLGSLFGSAAVKGAGTIGLTPQNATQNATIQPGQVQVQGQQGQVIQGQSQGQNAAPNRQQQQQYVGVFPALANSAVGVVVGAQPVVQQGAVVQAPVATTFDTTDANPQNNEEYDENDDF